MISAFALVHESLSLHLIFSGWSDCNSSLARRTKSGPQTSADPGRLVMSTKKVEVLEHFHFGSTKKVFSEGSVTLCDPRFMVLQAT